MEVKELVQNRVAMGIKFRSKRKLLDMTVEQVAAEADVKPATIEKIEAGMFNPSFDLMCRIARVLHCKIDLAWI